MKKKSLRVKLVKLVIKDFYSNHLCDQPNDECKIEFQSKLKDTFSFKCELIKVENVNHGLAGQIAVEKENEEIIIIDFSILPTGKILECF